ncbi:MAG: Ldh family oxidoreductase [Chloroflexia bacterium]|nr:Ldh family oxidoreductase [Chloroflexia bacterium]
MLTEISTKMYSYNYLLQFTSAILKKMGFSEIHAVESAKVFLAAELRGHSTHGVIRLGDYYKLWKAGRINVNPSARIIHETPSTAVIDGDNTLGMIPAKLAMETAIAKAKTAGTGWVVVKNSCNFGIAGYYAMMALDHDMIGITMTNASPLVAPTFAAEGMLGTNPIAVAIPALTQPPFVADFATTPVNRGKFTIAAKKGERMKAGFAQDKDGNASDDPTILEKGGSMLPLGGDREHGSHKGYSLGAIVDIFSAVLSGANFGPFVPPMVSYLPLLENKLAMDWDIFFGAMRVDAFRPADEFKRSMDEWIITFRNAKPAVGQEKVFIPGDPERECEKIFRKTGITLIPQVIEDLNAIARNFSIEFEIR